MNPLEDYPDITDDEVARAELMIARLRARLAKHPGDVFDRIALAGWERHLSYAKEEAAKYNNAPLD